MRKLFFSVSIILIVMLLAVPAMAAKTKVTIWNWSQEQKDFYEEAIAEFESANPDIDLEWITYVQDQYGQSLPLALRGGNGPDIYWVAPEANPINFVEKGWAAPIGDYIDTKFLNQFNENLFVEGSMYFGGELYTLPFYDRAKKMNGLMFINNEVFKKAGLDPVKDVPKTFADLRDVTKKITEAGNGEYYGIVWGGKPGREIHRILNGLLTTAAPASCDVRYDLAGFDYRDGKFKLSNDNHVEVYELLQGIVDDGSIIPGWSSMDKPTARHMFGQGKVAIYFDGVWMKNVWAGMGYENLDFGVYGAPVPDSGRRAYRSVGIPHGDVFVNAETEDMDKTMKVYRWLHSAEFQTDLYERFKENLANENIDYSVVDDPYLERIIEIYEENVIVHPVPTSKNPAAGAVEWPAVSPDWDDVYASALQSDMDFVDLAREWDEKMTQKLEQNIKKANDEGYDVSLDDFIFPDWNPLEDY